MIDSRWSGLVHNGAAPDCCGTISHMDIDRFFRSSILYITCTGGLIDTNSNDNFLGARGAKESEDAGLGRVQQTL